MMLIKRCTGFFFAVIACLVLTGSRAQSATYYVSTTGSDSNAGGISTPLANIATAIQKTVAGDTVYIRAGTYNQEIEPTSGGGSAGAGNGVTVESYPGESATVSGADQVTTWIDNGAGAGGGEIWKVQTGWIDQFGNHVNPQEIFVDGAAQQQIGIPAGLWLAHPSTAAYGTFANYATFEYPAQVGSAYTDLAPGRFYFDPSSDTTYLCLATGVNPNSHTTLVSRRIRMLFFPNSSTQYITFENIAWRYSNWNSISDIGYAVNLNPNDALIDCDVEWCDFGGVGFGQNDVVSGCIMSNNGDTGACASGQNGFIVSNCVMKNNNWRNFNPDWHAGGIKLVSSGTYGRVANNTVVGNHGQGIWLDTCSGGLNVVSGNYVNDNGGPGGTVAGQSCLGGIMIEATTGATVENNIVTNNTLRGIYISGSNSTNVFNNTIAYNGVTGGTNAALDVNVDEGSGRTLENNTVENNILYNNIGNIDLGLTVGPTSNGISGNTADYNLYYRSGGGFASNYDIQDSTTYPYGQMCYTLAAWQALGEDAHGKYGNPLFTTGTGGNYDYSFASTSPAYQTGTTSVGLAYDFYGQPRSGSGLDIGAIAYGSNVVHEAESGTLANGATIMSDAGCSNGARVGAMNVSNASITWSNVQGFAAGNYNLSFTYSSVGNPCKSLYVNGSRVSTLTFDNTGGWGSGFQSVLTVPVTLALGSNTVEIINDQNYGGDDIDKADVVKATTTYEAENGVLANGATVYTDAGLSNGASVGAMNVSNASITWNNVSVASSGSHTLTISYGTIGNPLKSLYVNGVKVQTLTFLNTGGWGSGFQANLSTTVNLNAGNNTIEIINDQNYGGVEFDAIVVGD